jgi:hypothetical protein
MFQKKGFRRKSDNFLKLFIKNSQDQGFSGSIFWLAHNELLSEQFTVDGKNVDLR